VGLTPHLARLQDGLDAISIDYRVDRDDWVSVIGDLARRHGGDHLGIYIQISRGADTRRQHAMPTGLEATRYAFAFEIPPPPVADKALATRYAVSMSRDLRWQRCHIKSTSLLGNVLHYADGQRRGAQETLLFNADDELTEAAACNVFIVRDGMIATPELDHQKLPGITRYMLLDMLRRHSTRTVEERPVSRDEVTGADEVWLTSSSKEVAPVVAIDGRPVGTGDVGDVWLEAQSLFCRHRFDY
jgi:D-alanine transaminase